MSINLTHLGASAVKNLNTTTEMNNSATVTMF